MSEEKSNVGFFDEEEEITLSENELNNILNNSTIELEESVENLENIDTSRESIQNEEDNLVIVSGSELEQEYLSKISQVENPLEEFKLVQDVKSETTEGHIGIVSSTEEKQQEIPTEQIEIEEEPVMEEKVEEIEIEEPVTEETLVSEEEAIAESLKEPVEEEIQIEKEEESPKIEELKADEDLVIEEIKEDEIILDETPDEELSEEITLEGSDEIQEPEETNELVIEEDTHEIALEEGQLEGSELGEVKVEPEGVIEETVAAKDEISIQEPPILEDTEELIIEEGVEEVVEPEIKPEEKVQEPPVTETKKEEIPEGFFQEEPVVNELELSNQIDEVMASPELQTQPEKESINVAGTFANAPENVKNVLLYLDSLFAYLPEEKIREFAKSKYYDMYNKIFDELGL